MKRRRGALLAPSRSGPSARPHLVPLAGEWALWRDVAVRTTGFPVSGLDIFGSPDERAGLRTVARDPLFQTAVTWQNRAAMANAVAKIADGAPAPGSAQRRREEVVASYWQRYCAKNDTIGFFGPLAWGRVADDGPAIHASCGRLVTESTVQFEAWAIQALAEALDPDLAVPAGPGSERDLRTQLERSPPGLRNRGLAALGYLCVVGDFHLGANPLGQGMFATRYPDRERFLGAISSDVGTLPFLHPPFGTGSVPARNMGAVTRPGDVHVIASPRYRMPDGYRTLLAADLVVDGETVTTRDGSWQAPLAHLLWLPMLIAGVYSYDPFPAAPAGGHGPRITIGRTVWRRETWDIPAAQGPPCPEAAADWARDRGMPRQVFVLSPSESKPVYVDFGSPVLTRIMCRQLRRAAADAPGQPARFTEMLPAPHDCWLAGEDGQRYTSELRLVAVDLGRGSPLPLGGGAA
jgi:Lantibiotic dehydratase, N terminus